MEDLQVLFSRSIQRASSQLAPPCGLITTWNKRTFVSSDLDGDYGSTHDSGPELGEPLVVGSPALVAQLDGQVSSRIQHLYQPNLWGARSRLGR